MTRHYRKVIRIKATDSPNVKLGLLQEQYGLPVTHTIVIPGVLPYADYKKRLATWDKVRICIGIEGSFYEGAELLLYPPEWLDRAERLALTRERPQDDVWLGVDTGEGGDDSAWAVVDRLGLLELIAYQTPDTTVIIGQTLALMHDWKIPAENVWFDRGGGGKEHADRLRLSGYQVNTMGFGESVTLTPKIGMRLLDERVEQVEDRYAYRTRRAQMYGRLSQLLDPANLVGFAIPERFTELRRQLCQIPKMYDQEGRLELPPKHKKNSRDARPSLTELIGCSPDEADSLVLGVFGAFEEQFQISAGGF